MTRRAFTMRGGELRLAKTVGPLRFTWSWPELDVAALDPTMVTILPGAGRPLVCPPHHRPGAGPGPLEPAGHAVGVDLGVQNFAVTSDGERIANPRHLARKARNLAPLPGGAWPTAQKGSANRAKAGRRWPAPTERSATRGGASFTAPARSLVREERPDRDRRSSRSGNMVRNRHLARDDQRLRVGASSAVRSNLPDLPTIRTGTWSCSAVGRPSKQNTVRRSGSCSRKLSLGARGSGRASRAPGMTGTSMPR